MPKISLTAVCECTNPSQEMRSREVSLAWQLPLVTGMLLGTRVMGLTRQSLWFDEGYTLALASSSSFHEFLRAFAGFTTSEHLQPLYYALIFLWSRLVGTSDYALRFPSAIFSVISGLIVFLLARRLVQGCYRAAQWFPLAAVAAYSVSSFAFYYAQEARPYALLQMVSFLVVLLWSCRRGFEGSHSKHASFVAACALATLTSPFAVLLIFTLAIADLFSDSSNWIARWKTALIVSGVVFTVYLILGSLFRHGFVGHDIVVIRQPLWMNVVYTVFGVLFGTTLGPSTSFLRSFSKSSLLATYWPLLITTAVVILTVLVGAFRVSRQRHSQLSVAMVTALAAAIYAAFLFIIFGLCGHLNVLPRHASALFGLIFVLSMALAASAASRTLPGGHTLVVGLAGVLMLNFISVLHYWSDPAYRKDDYRAVAALVRQRKFPSNTPTFLLAGNPLLLRHYGASVINASEVAPRDLAQFLLHRSGGAPRLQLIVNEYRGYRWNHRASPSEAIQSAFACDQQHLAYMEVLTCTRHPASDQAANTHPFPFLDTSYAR